MSARATYIHGTEPSEQERLAALNRMTNDAFLRFLAVPPGARVLEVGSGLGILASAVAVAAPGVTVVGIEQSEAQIAAASRVPGVDYRQGDAHALELPDESFDLVYARYLLEHVGDPARVVREMRRVARPGGRVAVLENDISLLRIDPPCPTFEKVWHEFQEYQAALGGDARIGRRLYRLFRQAGLTKIELSGQNDVHWHGSPFYRPWMENIVGNVESARRGLLAAGRCTEGEIESALAEVRQRIDDTDGSSQFMWNRAHAVR
jgi:ubiquinone/menaquinone biosynthesis C-methylase UbiE